MENQKASKKCPKIDIFLDAVQAIAGIPDGKKLEKEIREEFRKHKEQCDYCQTYANLLKEKVQSAKMTPECPVHIPNFHYEFAKDPSQFSLELRLHMLECGFCFSQIDYYMEKLKENPDYVPDNYKK